jgi:hypothetical protein
VQGVEGDGRCVLSCDDLPCSANASCKLIDGVPRCVCKPGYQDNGGDRVCRPSCESLSCDGHRHCEDASGIAQCVCDAGFTGANCDRCASGRYGPNCAGRCGSCLPTQRCNDGLDGDGK